jgi:putative flippase GtrA
MARIEQAACKENPSLARSTSARTGRALLSFASIGAIGFGIEASLLTILTQLAGFTPWQARIPSFLIAVTTTWVLNRQRTFAGRGLERRSVEALLYAGIQVGGALLNLAIFGVCLARFPQLGAIPVVPLGVGAIGGLAFNFGVSNVLLYSRPRATR